MNTLVVVEPREPSSDLSPSDLAKIANQEHELVLSAAKATIEHAIRAGEALESALSQIPKGQRRRSLWLEENFAGSEACANIYRRLARHADLLRSRRVEKVKEAIDLLTKQSTEDRARNQLEARGLRSAGYSYREIADVVGVSSQTVRVWVNPKWGAYYRRHARRRQAEKKALEREEARNRARQLKGPISYAFEHVRKLSQALDQAHGDASPEARHIVARAQMRLLEAEEEIGRAVRIWT